jgi:hypothetical protein
MNQSQSKEHELLSILENIERSYDPQSPLYKFNYIFYNIVDYPFERPYNFPPELWAKYLKNDKSLMPVILNKPQIDKRKQLQNELIMNINDSKNGLLKKIDNLKVKRETLKNKLETLILKYRRACRQYLMGEPNENVYKLYLDSLEREKYVVSESKEELVKYLTEMHEKLVNFEKKIGEFLFSIERKRFSAAQNSR